MGDRYVPRYDSWRPSDERALASRRDEDQRPRSQSRYYHDRHEHRHDTYRHDSRRVPQRRRAVATTTPTPARRSSSDRACNDDAQPGASYTFSNNGYTSERHNPGLGYASTSAPISFNGYTHHVHPTSNEYSQIAHPTVSTHYTASTPPAPQPTNSHSDRVMPKHFAKPLTCFYWATQGCQKTAEECWYCHYHTGIIAAAPVRLGGDGAIAGANASARAQEMAQDDSTLRNRMRIVNAKVASLNENEKRVKAETVELKRVLAEVYDALHHLSTAQSSASQTLTEQREDLTNTFLTSREAEPGEPLLSTLQTLDTTLTSLSTFKDRLSAVAHRLKSSVGVVEVGSSEEAEMDVKGVAALGGENGASMSMPVEDEHIDVDANITDGPFHYEGAAVGGTDEDEDENVDERYDIKNAMDDGEECVDMSG